MKNYISYRAGRGYVIEFLFFDDADDREGIEALELAKRARGAVFLRPADEKGCADWKAVPQIRGPFEASRVQVAIEGAR